RSAARGGGNPEVLRGAVAPDHAVRAEAGHQHVSLHAGQEQAGRAVLGDAVRADPAALPRARLMATHRAEATWEGDLASGTGRATLDSGAAGTMQVSWQQRAEGGVEGCPVSVALAGKTWTAR